MGQKRQVPVRPKKRKKIEKEESAARNIDMASIIERLKKEKSESKSTYKQRGYEEGLRWARSAHYDDLRYVLGWNEKMPPGDNPDLHKYLLKIIKGDRFMEVMIEDGRGDQYAFYMPPEHDSPPHLRLLSWVNDYADAFLAGWKRGVIEFWSQVEKHLS